MVPQAVPAGPRSVYHAKISVRKAVGVSWARVDSSMARKGPISLPLGQLALKMLIMHYCLVLVARLGLITPKILAATKIQ